MFGRKKKLLQSLSNELKHVKEKNGQALLFLKEIEKGNFVGFKTETQGEIDPLFQGLENLKLQLSVNQQQEQQRKWEMEGLAKFAEILRTTSNDQNYLSSILAWIVKYINVNQGALFLLNDDNQEEHFLELAATFAYNRKKYLTKRIEVGQGLIGQCYLEKDIIYLKEIPDNYLSITSGLGEANPRSILIVPMIDEEKVIGVVEFASFSELKPYYRDFIRKLMDYLASSINSIKINKRTAELLEASKAQTLELKEAEEELRQNMEEIKATQEELNRQLKESNVLRHELEARQQVLNLTTVLSESDPFGTIIFANEKLSEISKYSINEMIGKPHSLFRHPDMPRELFKIMWTTIKSGRPFRGVVKNRAKDGTHYWVDATIAPVFDDAKKIIKYIGMRYVIEDDHLAEQLHEKCKKELGL